MSIFIFIGISIILLISNYFFYKKALHQEELNNDIKEQNTLLEKEFNTLTNKKEELNISIDYLEKKIQDKQELTDLKYQNIEKEFQEKQTELLHSLQLMQNSYSKVQVQLMNELESAQNSLNEIKETRAAAIRANLREKEIAEQSSFYCLQTSEIDLLDIQRLNTFKTTLNKPRILSMLIWQTWYQKPLKALAARVLGTATVTGIYKITNTKTGECYIGQAVDVASRWSEHAKCGLGIDTPQGNKLYQAMQEYGLESFSWELLTECSRELLNEKEREFISLYQAVEFGYNSARGRN